MSDNPKTYGAILADATKNPRASLGVATLALVIATVGAVNGDDAAGTSARTTPEQLATVDGGIAASKRTGKRLDIATDVEVAAGASVTASGKVELGARLVAIADCVGQYSEATRICMLSPGPWELHSSCSEAPLAPATTCEISVRNTGTVPLKFSGYVEVAIEE